MSNSFAESAEFTCLQCDRAFAIDIWLNMDTVGPKFVLEATP